MATLNSAKRNTSGEIDAGYKAYARTIDAVVDFATDFTMGTATDDINLMTLPEGAMVVAVAVQQVAAGTGTGTVVARVGATTLTGTLLATAAAGTLAAPLPAALPFVVPAGGAELQLLGATAVRTDGKARVIVTIVEGDRSPRQAVVVARDVI
jgi:hypothetical protein